MWGGPLPPKPINRFGKTSAHPKPPPRGGVRTRLSSGDILRGDGAQKAFVSPHPVYYNNGPAPHLVELVLGHVHLILVQQLVRGLHGAELDLDLGLLLADVPQGVHQHPEVRQVVRDGRRQQLLVLLLNRGPTVGNLEGSTPRGWGEGKVNVGVVQKYSWNTGMYFVIWKMDRGKLII